MSVSSNTPPNGTRWIMAQMNLPQNYGLGRFEIKPLGGVGRTIAISKRIRQVLEALAVGPLYCASTVRLSHYVDILRDDHGVNIETLWFSDNKGPLKTRYGVYVLRDEVRFVGNPNGEAA